MARRLALGLFCEGRSDVPALAPILRRVSERAVLGAPNPPDIVEEVEPLIDVHKADASFSQRIRERVAPFRRALDIVFVHQDADRRAGDAARERIASVQLGKGWPELVPVVPVRSMEAWLLADGEAWRRALGVRLDDATLGLPKRPAEVEAVQAPKDAVDRIVATATGGRRRVDARAWFARVAEETSLERLDAVPAFVSMNHALREGLTRLGYLR